MTNKIKKRKAQDLYVHKTHFTGLCALGSQTGHLWVLYAHFIHKDHKTPSRWATVQSSQEHEPRTFYPHKQAHSKRVYWDRQGQRKPCSDEARARVSAVTPPPPPS